MRDAACASHSQIFSRKFNLNAAKDETPVPFQVDFKIELEIEFETGNLLRS